jgi:hypothetical protein
MACSGKRTRRAGALMKTDLSRRSLGGGGSVFRLPSPPMPTHPENPPDFRYAFPLAPDSLMP